MVVSVMEDVTPHRMAKEALRESEERFALAMKGANEGLWDIRFDKGTVYFSPRWKSLLGYEEDEFTASLSEWRARIAAKDRRRALAALRRLRAGVDRELDIDLSMRRKDGKWRDMRVRGFPVFDRDSKIARIVGTMNDVTRSKRQAVSQRLAAAIFASTQEGVVVTDARSKIVAVNPAFQAITGFSEQDAVGSSMSILHSGRQDAQFYKDMWAQLQQTGQWQGESLEQAQGREIYPQWLTISTVRTEDAGINYVGVFADITRLKQSESRLAFLAHYNPLTGLPNRLLLQSRLEQSILRAGATKTSGAVLFLDLDRFKTVNDSLGRAAGDEISTASPGAGTSSSIPPTLWRVLASTNSSSSLKTPTRTRPAIWRASDRGRRTAVHPEFGREAYVGLSIGVSLFPRDAAQAETLIQQADSALYVAKGMGGSAFWFYSGVLTAEANARLELETGVRRGDRTRRVRTCVSAGRRHGERQNRHRQALLRWRSPTASSRRTISYRWPKRPVSLCRWAISCCVAPARRCAAGLIRACRSNASP